jgi:hypothetical protein
MSNDSNLQPPVRADESTDMDAANRTTGQREPNYGAFPNDGNPLTDPGESGGPGPAESQPHVPEYLAMDPTAADPEGTGLPADGLDAGQSPGASSTYGE